MQRALWLFVSCLSLLLIGCAKNSAQQTLFAALKGDLSKVGPSIADATLKPDYRYLRVDMDGFASVLLVLGYAEPDPGGTVEVWYSSIGEVIKTQQGRIVGTVGLATDWSSVIYRMPPMAWSELQGQPAVYERERNVLPSYRFRVAERVAITPIPQSGVAQLPPALFGGGLRKADAAKYRWYQEQAAGAVAPDLPVAWFAVGRHDGRETVVFSRQCLAPDLCMNLQLWPVQHEALKP